MIRKIALSSLAVVTITATASLAATAGIATARTAFDGAWSLSIMTQRGACDRYNFPVRISNGNVTFPGLVRANGRVTPKGAVRVTVAAGDKSASGFGRLSLTSGSGRWSGRSGNDRCSGTWTAQRG